MSQYLLASIGPLGSLCPNLATCTRVPVFGRHLLVLYWTGTRWSGVNDERVKEGKTVTQPAFVLQGISQKLRKRERETKKERKKEMGTQALMEQRCFNQHGVGIYTVLQGSYSQQK